MRVPVARVEQHETLPAPGISLIPGRKLGAEPDAQFIRDIASCIRAGSRPLTAARWLGCSRKQWKRWRERRGGVFDELHEAVQGALLHLEMKLRADLAKRSPAQALKGLRPLRDDDPEPEPRAYHQSGLHTLKKNLPHVLDRINDDTVPARDLSPLEAAARQWRDSVISDLGGREALTTTKHALVNATLGSWLLLSTIDGYLFELAGKTGVVNRRTRSVFAVVEQRARIADSLLRQLVALGLDRVGPPPMSLDQYIAQRYGHDGKPDALPEPKKES
jgi:hypothetical protein